MHCIRSIACCLPLAVMLAIPSAAYSAAMLSPGLAHLAAETTMIQSGLFSEPITFTEEDFTRAVGSPIDSITLTALPPASDGILYYGTMPAAVNQVFSASSLSALRFVPSGDYEESSFRFKTDASYSIACILRSADGVNHAPTIGEDGVVAAWTQQDITTYGTLSAHDSDGDRLTYEIVSPPTRGIVSFTNVSSGDYRYTPCDGIRGEDRFTYVVRDEWGAYSDVGTVVIDIDEAAAELVFADMNEHWAHNAALVMAAEEAMDVKAENGLLYFEPEASMTREDFLVTVMKVLGAGEIAPCRTVFADDAMISAEASGYIQRAYNLGVIRGSEEKSGLCFKPQDPITRAEAAIILATILGTEEPDTVPVFADGDAVPTWARPSLYALSELGVFRGTGAGNLSPNDGLNRAETAQLLLSVKKIIE